MALIILVTSEIILLSAIIFKKTKKLPKADVNQFPVTMWGLTGFSNEVITRKSIDIRLLHDWMCAYVKCISFTLKPRIVNFMHGVVPC